MEYTKENFKTELEKLREIRERDDLTDDGIIRLEMAEKYENLILFGVGISLESKEQKILALLLIKHIKELDVKNLKNPDKIEDYRRDYHRLLEKINEV